MAEIVPIVLLFTALSIGAIVLIAMVAGHASRLRQLEEQLAGVRGLIASLERAIEELREGRATSRAGPAPVPKSAAVAARPAPAESPAQAKAPAPPTLPQQAPAHEAKPPTATAAPRPSRSREEWEALIGGKLLNRIGALALILAVGFFLKYAIDQDWITETARLVIGAVVGLACLFLAYRTAKRGFQVFAQGLVGAGIAILYLTVYASFNFYAQVSQPVAFVLMAAVTVLAFLQAFRYNALAVSLLGLLGGFLTPILLHTDQPNVPGLFTYLFVLDLGLLGVVVRRDKWMVLEPLAFLGTCAIYFMWYTLDYSDTHLWTAAIFLAAVWALFHAADILRVRRGVTELADLRRLLAVFYGVVLYGSLLSLLSSEGDETNALVALILGALYAVSAVLCRKTAPPARSAVHQYLASAVVLLFSATIIYLEEYSLIVVCSLEALLLVWLGMQIKEKAIWRTAVAFLPLVFLILLATPGAIAYAHLEEYRFLLSERVLAYVVLGIAFALIGALYSRVSSSRPTLEALHYGWIVILFLGLAVETNDLFRFWSAGRPELVAEHLEFQRTMTIAGVWALTCLPILGFGLGSSSRPLIYAALWMLVVSSGLAMLRGLIYVPIEEYRLVLNMRTAVLVIVSSASYGAYASLKQSGAKFSFAEEFRALFRFVPVVAMLVLFSTETWDFFRHAKLTLQGQGGAAELTRLANLQHLSLSSIWLLFSIVLMVLGFSRRDRAFRIQAIGLFGIAILKIFLYDLSFLERLYRIFSFVGLGVILLLVSYLYQRYKEIILSPSRAGESLPPS